jgi:hypothetical protein
MFNKVGWRCPEEIMMPWPYTGSAIATVVLFSDIFVAALIS